MPRLGPPAGRPAKPRRRAPAVGRAVALCLAACLPGACSGPAFVAALTPESGYRVERDIPYGPGERQRLDLYVPAGAGPGAPLLVFFYGGRWESRSKDLYPFVGQAFASRGYVTAIPDYRLYPEVRYPAFLRDAAAAVARLVRLPPRARGGGGAVGGEAADPPRPLFLAGHSAGAYIAAMLALDQRWLREAEAKAEAEAEAEASGGPPCARLAVDAGVGLAGPYDFLPLDDPVLREIFGPGPAAPSTQPISHVDPTDPPMLLVAGTGDDTVRPGNTLRLAARLREAGSRAETRLYDGIGHVRLVAALAAPLRFLAPVLDDADAFLREIAAGERRGRCRP